MVVRETQYIKRLARYSDRTSRITSSIVADTQICGWNKEKTGGDPAFGFLFATSLRDFCNRLKTTNKLPDDGKRKCRRSAALLTRLLETAALKNRSRRFFVSCINHETIKLHTSDRKSRGSFACISCQQRTSCRSFCSTTGSPFLLHVA